MRIKIDECVYCGNKTVVQNPNSPLFVCTTCNTKYDLFSETAVGTENEADQKKGIIGTVTTVYKIISQKVTLL